MAQEVTPLPKLVYHLETFDDSPKEGLIKVYFKMDDLVDVVFNKATEEDKEVGVTETNTRLSIVDPKYKCIRYSIKKTGDKYVFNWLRQNGEFQNHEEFETLEELKDLISKYIRDHEQDMKSRRKSK